MTRSSDAPLEAYLRCTGCDRLTRLDLLDDKRTAEGLKPYCRDCYGPGWTPFMASWAKLAEPAHQKEG
jgi:hypothetical protein